MSELIVVGFDDAFEADRVLTTLLRLEREYLIDLEDAVVATRRSDGTVRLRQTVSPTALGASSGLARGALWGGLVGLLFLAPIAGIAVGGLAGAGIGALAGTTIDYGIDDGVMTDIAETPKPHTSALFLLVRKAQPEKVIAAQAVRRPYHPHLIVARPGRTAQGRARTTRSRIGRGLIQLTSSIGLKTPGGKPTQINRALLGRPAAAAIDG